MATIHTIQNVADIHRFAGLGKPKHPLITVYRHCPRTMHRFDNIRIVSGLYIMSLKDGVTGAFGYGRNTYDFEEGAMVYVAPGQTITSGEHRVEGPELGWTIFFHPDLIRRSPLGKTISRYNFFSYDITEALHLSEREKATLRALVDKIEDELEQNTDAHSQTLIISNLELILQYSQRYYDRQFYTRTPQHNDAVSRFEHYLQTYFREEDQLNHGLPTVAQSAEQLGMSPNYLSDLLRKETGQSAQDHIHAFVIEQAKTRLLSSRDTVSDIAFALGFDYSQHFSRLFKAKTGMSPRDFRGRN